MGRVGKPCLPSNAYYPRTPDYTLYSGVHVCWSEHSDSSFVYGFMSLDYGLNTITTTTFNFKPNESYSTLNAYKTSSEHIKIWLVCALLPQSLSFPKHMNFTIAKGQYCSHNTTFRTPLKCSLFSGPLVSLRSFGFTCEQNISQRLASRRDQC